MFDHNNKIKNQREYIKNLKKEISENIKKIKDIQTIKEENIKQSFLNNRLHFSNAVNHDESEIDSLMGVADRQKLSKFIPRWIPDDIVNSCKLCEKQFGCFVRKHHCRICGDIFCSKCSNRFDYFHPFYNRKVRICVDCENLKKSQSNNNN